MTFAALYVLGVSLATFAAFWADKRAARRGGRRIPERTLLALALVGGTPGAFAAQALLRHKTRKYSFRVGLWFTAGFQAFALMVVYLLKN